MAASVLEIYIDGEKVLLYFNDFEMTWGACMELTQNTSAGFSVDENGYVLYQNKFLVKEGSTQYITTSDYINTVDDSYQTVKPAKHGAYIGASGVARKIKKIYVGVNGIARKVKKAYIGVGGVARLCWTQPTIVTISGTGDETYCYADINGIKYSSAATVEVDIGSEISIFVSSGSRPGQRNCYIALNGVNVQDGAGNYIHIVDTSCNVSLHYDVFGSAEITTT